MSAALAMPLSAFELRDAVRHARRFNPAGLDRVLRMDAERGLAEVQASAQWSSVAAHLDPQAPEVQEQWRAMPRIGQAIAENLAGPDGRPLVAYLESLALVTPDGELRRASRDTHPELFALAVGGHGLFGALYSATLRLEALGRAGREFAPGEVLMLPAAAGSHRPLNLLLPPGRLASFLEAARSHCDEWRLAIEGVRVRPIVAENETVLRWAGRDYAAVTLLLAERGTIGGSVRGTQLRRELIDAAIAHEGSYAIGSTPEATRAQAEACYPQLKAILAEKRRMDPGEKLGNDWYRHHRSLFGREACDVRWNR